MTDKSRNMVWRELYARFQAETKPLWDKFLPVQDAFWEAYKESDGPFGDCWEKKVLPSFLELEEKRRPILEMYEARCYAIGALPKKEFYPY